MNVYSFSIGRDVWDIDINANSFVSAISKYKEKLGDKALEEVREIKLVSKGDKNE